MDAIEFTIEKLVYGGEGLAHANGATVFVPYVLPSERISATAVEEKRKFVRARVQQILAPAAERVAPRCPHFGACGGCHYQHAGYEAQLRYKREILRETIRRIGGIEWHGEIAEHPSPPWGYRNRAQWKLRPLAGGARQMEIGYLRASSSALSPVNECAILSPGLREAFLALRAAARQGALPDSLREIEAFSARASGQGEDRAAKGGLLLTATFAGFPRRAAELAERLHGLLPKAESILFHDPAADRMELFGPGFVTYPAGEFSYRVGHFSFFQVNDFLVDELGRAAAAVAEPGELALDLFAGAGLFTLPLAKSFSRVIAAEANPAAARDLEFNARGQRNIEVRASNAERFVAKVGARPGLAVLDPPRAGLSDQLVQRLLELRPSRIHYASCEPPTLARDLRKLIAGGYAVESIELFDLFPQTFHMETLARLRRAP